MDLLALAAICAAGLLLLFHSLQTLLQGVRNPLSSIPGPWFTRWTGLVTTYHWLKGNRANPEEVHVNDVEAARTIHKVSGGYLKSEWYRRFAPAMNHSVFSTVDPEYHSRHRRLLSSPLSDQSLRSMEATIRKRIDLAIQSMQEESKTRGVTDIYKWWIFLATDVIGELTFGDSFRMLEQGKKNQYSLDLEKTAKTSSLRATFPTLVKFARLSPIPIPVFKEVANASQRTFNYANESIQRHKRLVASEPATSNRTLFTKLFQAGEEGLPDHEILSEAQTYIVAGSDTTANTLTYLVWSVCRHPEIKQRLVQELATLPEGFSDQDTRSCEFLQYVIQETLRLFSAAPSALPRVVPDGGRNLAGYWLPGGATVSTQAYSLHRDPLLFPEPESFNPSRWEKARKEMRDAFMPFGGGSRICIGLNLAQMELRIATAHFFRSFPNAKVTRAENFGEEDMDPMIYFLLIPKGKRCLIQLS